MVFEPAEKAARTLSRSETLAAKERLQFARRAHKHSCEELFQLCYEIEVTGEFPDPAALVRAILQYRETRALLEERSAEPHTETATKADVPKTLLERFRIP